MKEVTDTERLDAMISEEAHVYNTGDAWKDKTRAWCCATFYDVKHYGLTPRDAIDCLVSQCRGAVEHDNYNRMMQETRAEAKALEAKVQAMVQGSALTVKLDSNGWQYEHDGATYYGGSDVPLPRRQLRHEARQQVAVVTGRQDTEIRWDMTPLEREGRDSGDLLGR